MNAKPNFSLPQTAMCVVRFSRDGKKMEEQLIDTPRNRDGLFAKMLGFGVGYSMIRAVKAVDAGSLVNAINLGNIRRHKA